MRVAATGATDPEKEVFKIYYTAYEVILSYIWCPVVEKLAKACDQKYKSSFVSVGCENTSSQLFLYIYDLKA